MRKLVSVVVLAGALLAGCGSDASPQPTGPSGPAEATGAPDAALVAWADQVCRSTADLRLSVAGLGTAAAMGGPDVAAALGAQAATVRTSATALVDSITAMPSSVAGSPDALAIAGSADAVETSVSAVEDSVATLAGAADADEVSALVGVGTAVTESLAATSAAADAVVAAMGNGGSTLGRAFAANPTCAPLRPDEPVTNG